MRLKTVLCQCVYLLLQQRCTSNTCAFLQCVHRLLLLSHCTTSRMHLRLFRLQQHCPRCPPPSLQCSLLLLLPLRHKRFLFRMLRSSTNSLMLFLLSFLSLCSLLNCYVYYSILLSKMQALNAARMCTCCTCNAAYAAYCFHTAAQLCQFMLYAKL